MPPSQRKKAYVFSVGLIDMGRMSDTALRVVLANVQTMLEVPVEMLPAMPIPKEAFQPHRGQNDAGLVLRHLGRCFFPLHSRILAVTDVDLCTPILTYVFGEAEMGLKFSIVSDFRLKYREDGTAAPAEVYYERLVKVALHEMAHTLSLCHCETSGCLMRIVATTGDLDRLDLRFCKRCRFVLHRNLKELGVR